MWATPCEFMSSEMCRQRRPRSDCAFAQSDQCLRCPLTESLGNTECISGKQRPVWYFVHTEDDPKLRISCMFEDIFAWHGPCKRATVQGESRIAETYCSYKGHYCTFVQYAMSLHCSFLPNLTEIFAIPLHRLTIEHVRWKLVSF